MTVQLSPNDNQICDLFYSTKKKCPGTSLVAWWLRIRLPMQGTRVWEDPACCGATKPATHNYRACVLQLLKLVRLEPVLHNKRSHRHEKPMHCNEEQLLLAATRESPRTAMKTQHSQKINKQKKVFRQKKLKKKKEMSSFPCFPSSSLAALSVNHLLSVIHWLFTTQSLETKVNLCSCVQAIVRIHLSGIQWRKHSCSCLNMQNGVPCACLVFLFVFCFVFRVVYANGSYIFLRFHKSGDYMVDAQYIGKQ